MHLNFKNLISLNDTRLVAGTLMLQVAIRAQHLTATATAAAAAAVAAAVAKASIELLLSFTIMSIGCNFDANSKDYEAGPDGPLSEVPTSWPASSSGL